MGAPKGLREMGELFPEERKSCARLLSCICAVLAVATATGCVAAGEGPEDPFAEQRKALAAPSPPYVFNLRGLSAEEIKKLKKVPGVQKVTTRGKRVRVVWQPYAWKPKRQWIEDADKIYDFLAIKGKLGKTKWTHGGRTSGGSGEVIFSQYREQTWGMMFNDLDTGRNEIMQVFCYCEALPGQIEHEMLRYIAGTKVSIEKCGDGYVIVSRAGRGIIVAWQISNQAFAVIYNSYDKKMVAAYVNRLGNTIPKGYKVSGTKWVENEIRWRIQQIDRSNAWDKRKDTRRGRAGIVLFGQEIWAFFPDVQRIKGTVDFEKLSPLERWEWLNWTRNFLWANRKNFKYDDRSRGYLLKGKSLYDPKRPPKLPDGLKGPSPPTPEQIKQVKAPDKPSPELAKILNARTPPYVFNLGGLTAKEITALKKVPGVQEARLKDKRVRVTWQPYVWKPRRWWVKGSERVYDFLAIKKKIGNTKWSHGGRMSGRAGTIIFDQYRTVSWGVMFDDLKSRRNEVMAIYCFNSALPGQVEHEMLRGVVGTKVSVEKCGDGYAVVSRAGRGNFVVWQVSDQIFVRIDNSYDKDMVAAYVNRLGSVIPKNYTVSVDKWVENEIRWRIQQIDQVNAWDKRKWPQRGSAGLIHYGAYVWMFFPDVQRIKGTVTFEKLSPLGRWEWLNWTRNFLWANRKNFKYDDRTRGYILKGKSLYDPKRPPKLPDELKGPPRPTPEQIRQMEAAAKAAKEKKKAASSMPKK